MAGVVTAGGEGVAAQVEAVTDEGVRPERPDDALSPPSTRRAWRHAIGASSGHVDVDAGWGFEDDPGLLGVDAMGAGVVDEEGEAVGGEPDVASFAALA